MANSVNTWNSVTDVNNVSDINGELLRESVENVNPRQ